METFNYAMAQPYKILVVLKPDEVKEELVKFWATRGEKLMKETPGSWTKLDALREHLEKKEGNKLYWDIIWDWSNEAIKKSNLEVVNITSISIDKFDAKNGGIISVVVDLLPKVKLSDYKNIKIPMPPLKAQPKEIEGQALLALDHSPLATTEKLEKIIEYGESVEVSYKFYELEKPDNILGRAENEIMILNNDVYAKEIIDAVVGESAPSKIEKIVKFEPDYPHKLLAGKEVLFDMDIKYVVVKHLPTMEEEATRESLTVDQWKDKFKSDIEKNKIETFEIRKKDFMRTEVEKFLLSTCEIDPIPDSMIEKETEGLIQTFARNAGKTVEEYEKSLNTTRDDLFRELAPLGMRRVMVKLIVNAISSVENFQVTEEKNKEYLLKYASERGKTEDETLKEFKDIDTTFLVKTYMVDEMILNTAILVPQD